MEEFFYRASSLLVIILLCVGAFIAFVGLITIIIHEAGSKLFGQRFDDWWDSNFWF